MVKVIEVPPLPVAGVQGADLPVGGVKAIREAPEELCHGQVRLGVAHVDRRVDEPCPPVGAGDEVPRPQVPVEEGRGLRLGQQVRQTVQQPAEVCPVGGIEVPAGHLHLGDEPAVPEEVHPGLPAVVALGGRADEVVLREPEPPRRDEGPRVRPVEGGQLPAEDRPEVRRPPSAPDHFQHEKRDPAPAVHPAGQQRRRGDGAGGGDGPEPGGLGGKEGRIGRGIGFDKDLRAAAEGEAPGLVDVPAADIRSTFDPHIRPEAVRYGRVERGIELVHPVTSLGSAVRALKGVCSAGCPIIPRPPSHVHRNLSRIFPISPGKPLAIRERVLYNKSS